MIKYNFLKALVGSLSAIMLIACSPAIYQKSRFSDDDMYASHSRVEINQNEIDRQNATKLIEQMRMQQWANIMGWEVDELAQQGAEYDTPYGEKLKLIGGYEYQTPSSYYQYDEALKALAQYDPAEYTASVTSNGEVVVEPKYSNSLYGSWETTYYVDYRWSYGYPYGYPYGYYPNYGYYPYYSYRPHYYHRPPHYYRPARRVATRSIVTTAKSYSPNSYGVSRNLDGSTVGRSTSSGSSSYNRSAASRSSSSSSSSSISRSSSSSTTQSTTLPSSSSVKTNAIGR